MKLVQAIKIKGIVFQAQSPDDTHYDVLLAWIIKYRLTSFEREMDQREHAKNYFRKNVPELEEIEVQGFVIDGKFFNREQAFKKLPAKIRLYILDCWDRNWIDSCDLWLINNWDFFQKEAA